MKTAKNDLQGPQHKTQMETQTFSEDIQAFVLDVKSIVGVCICVSWDCKENCNDIDGQHLITQSERSVHTECNS